LAHAHANRAGIPIAQIIRATAVASPVRAADVVALQHDDIE
jgi:hypothetical protein